MTTCKKIIWLIKSRFLGVKITNFSFRQKKQWSPFCLLIKGFTKLLCLICFNRLLSCRGLRGKLLQLCLENLRVPRSKTPWRIFSKYKLHFSLFLTDLFELFLKMSTFDLKKKRVKRASRIHEGHHGNHTCHSQLPGVYVGNKTSLKTSCWKRKQWKSTRVCLWTLNSPKLKL